LESVLSRRLQNAEEYDSVLAGGPWRKLNQWRQSGVCWRYSLLVDFPDQLAEFSEAARHDGFHVSNLYWPVNDFFLPSDACPKAEAFARRIVNLWVDRSVDRDWVHQCANSLLKNRPRRTM
jgi:dTDP-4-amino-4,6-dideoxygalactose transaminase